MKAQPRLIGILGGMGPAATADLLQKLVAASPACGGQDHVPLIIWNVPQIPSRSDPLLDPGADSPCEGHCLGARMIAQAGAQAIAVACNTAHRWASDISQASGLPLLHIADAALEIVAARQKAGARPLQSHAPRDTRPPFKGILEPVTDSNSSPRSLLTIQPPP